MRKSVRNMWLRCFFFLNSRSKTYLFEEFLFAWQDRLKKLDQPTTMSIKLQAEVDKYKVRPTRVGRLIE